MVSIQWAFLIEVTRGVSAAGSVSVITPWSIEKNRNMRPILINQFKANTIAVHVNEQ